MIPIHMTPELYEMKKSVNCTEIAFLKELKNAKIEEKTLTQDQFSREYNISPRHVQRIVASLEEKGLLEKMKDGFFIIEYRITKNGERILN